MNNSYKLTEVSADSSVLKQTEGGLEGWFEFNGISYTLNLFNEGGYRITSNATGNVVCEYTRTADTGEYVGIPELGYYFHMTPKEFMNHVSKYMHHDY